MEAIAGGLKCRPFDGSGLSRFLHFLSHFRMCPFTSTKRPHKILIGIVLNLCINLWQVETLGVLSFPMDIYSLSPQLFKSYFLSVGFQKQFPVLPRSFKLTPTYFLVLKYVVNYISEKLSHRGLPLLFRHTTDSHT